MRRIAFDTIRDLLVKFGQVTGFTGDEHYREKCTMKHRRLYDFFVFASVNCLGVSALLSVWYGRLEANPATDPVSVREPTRPPTARWPINQHGITGKRKPFWGSQDESASSQGEISVEGIYPALKSLGLKLKGTVVTGYQGPNVAIIERLGRQEICYERGQVEQAQIQKVLFYEAIIIRQVTDFYKTLVKGGYVAQEIKRCGHPQTLQFKIQ